MLLTGGWLGVGSGLVDAGDDGTLVGVGVGLVDGGRVVLGAGLGQSLLVQATVPSRNAAMNVAVAMGRCMGPRGGWLVGIAHAAVKRWAAAAFCLVRFSAAAICCWV